MKIRHSVPIVLDAYTPMNVLRAGLDEIRRSRGRDTPLIEPTRLFPWFWATARNGVITPEESDFVLANQESFVTGLRQGHAVIQPELADGLAAIVERDAILWPDGPLAVRQASKSLRNSVVARRRGSVRPVLRDVKARADRRARSTQGFRQGKEAHRQTSAHRGSEAVAHDCSQTKGEEWQEKEVEPKQWCVVL